MRYRILNAVGIAESKLPFSVANKPTIHIRIENAKNGAVHIGGRQIPYVNGCATVEVATLHEGEIPISFIDNDGRGYILEPLRLTYDKQIDRGTPSPLFVDGICRCLSLLNDYCKEFENRLDALEHFCFPEEWDIL